MRKNIFGIPVAPSDDVMLLPTIQKESFIFAVKLENEIKTFVLCSTLQSLQTFGQKNFKPIERQKFGVIFICHLIILSQKSR